MLTLDPIRLLNPTLLVTRGVFSIAFGIFALFLPGAALLTIAMAYGLYAFVDGILAIITGVRLGREGRRWGWPIFEGILGIATGVVTFAWPGITIFVLSFLVGFWALFTGITEVAEAFKLSRPQVGKAERALLGIAGVLSIALGVAVFFWPLLGAITLVTLIGVYAIVFGGIFVGLGAQMRQTQRRLGQLELTSRAA